MKKLSFILVFVITSSLSFSQETSIVENPNSPETAVSNINLTQKESNINSSDTVSTLDSNMRIALKGGYSEVTINFANLLSVSAPGFTAGVSGEKMLNENFAIQPEFLYSRVDEANILYLPVSAKYYIIENLSVHAGPQLSYLLNGEEDSQEYEDDIDNILEFKQLGVDIVFGTEFNFTKSLFAEARYSLGMTNRMNVDIMNVKANTFQIGMGYRFK